MTEWLLAQFRYLETVYDSRVLFERVAETDLERWPSTVRKLLIVALPVVIMDADVQQGRIYTIFFAVL